MERSEFGQNLTKAFEVWKEGKATVDDTKNLDRAFKFAFANGIDLVIKMPKSVLNQPVDTIPILRQDAIFFSTGLEGDFLLFDVPSMMNEKFTGSKRLGLRAKDVDGLGTCIELNSMAMGVPVATFLPDEIASIELK